MLKTHEQSGKDTATLMAEIGRRGGRSSASRRRANLNQGQDERRGDGSMAGDAGGNLQPVAEETSTGS